MKLGIDIDGVLADFMKPAKDIAEAVTGKLIYEPALDWDWTNWHITDLQMDRIWEIIKDTSNFWMLLTRLPGVNPSDLIALDQHHTLYFITTRVPTKGLTVEKQSAYWLSHSLGLTHPTVLVSKHKDQLAKALKLDAMIDDKPENLAGIAQASPTTQLYLMDQSYNQHEKRFERVNTFEEFAKKYAAN